jgi:hypothetical protein
MVKSTADHFTLKLIELILYRDGLSSGRYNLLIIRQACQMSTIKKISFSTTSFRGILRSYYTGLIEFDGGSCDGKEHFLGTCKDLFLPAYPPGGFSGNGPGVSSGMAARPAAAHPGAPLLERN